MKLQIETVGINGYGIARAEGRTIFVPYALPQDVVEATITHSRKDIAFASIDSYIKQSEYSIKPNCEAFGHESRCGGCDWLNCSYDAQLKFKTQLIRDVFLPLKLADSRLIRDIIPSPIQRHYRNKVFLPVSSLNNHICYGIYERFSHRVVPHESCILQHPIIDQICQKIIQICRKSGIEAYDEKSQTGCLRHIGIRTNHDGSEIIAVLVTKSMKLPFSKLFVKELVSSFPILTGIVQNVQRKATNVILGVEDKLLWGKDSIQDQIGNIHYRIHYRSFFQINNACTKLLYDYIKGKVTPGARLIDAYCGIGTIGLYVADAAGSVLGMDEVDEAIGDARENAGLNGISNAKFICAKTQEYLQQNTLMGYDTLIFDPPRKGLEASIIDTVCDSAIEQIIYVSCNPMTLARDLKLFRDRGFQISSIQPFDMFPQTWHIETVATLTR